MIIDVLSNAVNEMDRYLCEFPRAHTGEILDRDVRSKIRYGRIEDQTRNAIVRINNNASKLQ